MIFFILTEVQSHPFLLVSMKFKRIIYQLDRNNDS